MPYIGNYHVTGDTASNFRILDDISSFTATFNPALADLTNDRIQILEHRFVTGQRVTYGNGGGSDIGGLSNGGIYYIIKYDRDHIRLAASAANATNNIAVNISTVGTGSAHTLNVAFDGVNKVFRPTKDNGKFCRISRAAQVQISINGVIQKPNPIVGSNPITEGFKLDAGGNIEFASAPTSLETFWGQIIAEALATFDIADNELDTFTGNGTTTDFTLSRTVPNNASVVVTIDGVVQHATDNQGNRAYSVYDTTLAFSAAPALGAEIQVRHIGFASPVNSDVTSFHGRVGPVTIIDSDPVVAIHSAGLGIGTVRTLDFVGAGNSIRQVGDTIEISIAGGGGGGSGVIHKETFNVTANQTIFDLANSYNTGYVDVFVNGVRLSPSDFTETSSTRITLAEPAIPGDVVDVLIHSSVVQNTILDSSIDNLTVNDSLTGQIGGGEETVGIGSASFLAEVISMPSVLACGATATVQPKTGHDITFVKYQEVQITGDADLILGGTADFVIDVHNLAV